MHAGYWPAAWGLTLARPGTIVGKSHCHKQQQQVECMRTTGQQLEGQGLLAEESWRCCSPARGHTAQSAMPPRRPATRLVWQLQPAAERAGIGAACLAVLVDCALWGFVALAGLDGMLGAGLVADTLRLGAHRTRQSQAEPLEAAGSHQSPCICHPSQATGASRFSPGPEPC